MPIIKRIEQAGQLVLETIYIGRAPRSVSGIWTEAPSSRSPRQLGSDERQLGANRSSSRRRLELLLAANFGFASAQLLGIGWRDSRLPRSRLDALAETKAYVRRVDYALSAQSPAAGWRYVFVIEEQHGEGRMHVHMVVAPSWPQLMPVIAGCWGAGEAVWEPLDTDRWRGYRELAVYLLKEQGTRRSTIRPGQHMWHASRDLIRPEPAYEIVEGPEQLALPEDAYVIERHESSGLHGPWMQRLYVLDGYDQQRYRRYMPDLETKLGAGDPAALLALCPE